jgi:hypothetical protein
MIETHTKIRLVKTSQERDCITAKMLVAVPTIVAKAARDSREDCMCVVANLHCKALACHELGD